MQISRRDFLRYCGASAATLALSSSDFALLQTILASPAKPSVLWLHGAGCTGCTISFLNRVSGTAPKDAADVLINSVNLVYHPSVMAAAGDQAVASALETYAKGNYILVVEGGVPTAFNGAACWAWTYKGQDVTFMQAVKDLSSRAKSVVTIGNCACYGGMSAAAPNPTGVKSVQAVTGKKTLNIAGCPPHPDWVVWAIVQLLLNKKPAVDSYGRPTGIYSKTIHKQCPRREKEEAERFGMDGRCLEELGCRGPDTKSPCATMKWNNGVNWCIGANAPCYGCTEPSFPKSPLWAGESDD